MSNTKTIVVDDRTFFVKKFNAKTGLKLARMVVSKVSVFMPLMDTLGGVEDAKAALAAITDDNAIEIVKEFVESVSDSDMEKLVTWSLESTYEQLNAGMTPVLYPSGVYGIPDIEDNIALTMRFIYEAIAWTLKGFFNDSQEAFGGVDIASLFQQKQTT